MKIAVTATGISLEDRVEERFGRAPYFVLIDTETMEHEALRNPHAAAGGGAGIQSAQMMAQRNVLAVLTGNCGPNAFQVFGAAGIQVIVGVSGTVREAVEKFKSGAYQISSLPNVGSHFGMGGRGMMGGGRGMGQGRGIAQVLSSETKAEPAKETEMEMLKKQSQALQEQLKDIQAKIEDVERKEKE